MVKVAHCLLSAVYCPLTSVHSLSSTMNCLLSTVYSRMQGTATFSVFCLASLQPTALLFWYGRKELTQKKKVVCLQGRGRLVMPFLHRQWGWAACRWVGPCSHPLPRSLQSLTGCVRSCSREACTVMLLEVGAPCYAMQCSAKPSLALLVVWAKSP